MKTLVPCEVVEVWHDEGACETPFRCELESRPGVLQAIPTRTRAALELAGRDGDPLMLQAAVWVAQATVVEVGGEKA